MFVRSQCSFVLSFLSCLVFRPFLVSFRSQFPYVRSVRKLRREANPPNTRAGMIWGCLEKDLFEVTIQNYTIRVSATLFLLRSSSLSDMQRKAMFLSCYSYLLYIAMRKEQSTSLMRQTAQKRLQQKRFASTFSL